MTAYLPSSTAAGRFTGGKTIGPACRRRGPSGSEILPLVPRRSQRPFVEEVPRLLEARGMTLRGLARDAGVNPSFLSRVLNQRRSKKPSAELVRNVAQALGLPDDYFPEYREAAVIEAVKRNAGLRERLYRRVAR